MTIFGYARVSTRGETLDAQLEALKAGGCEAKNIFREKIAGGHADRPRLGPLLDAIGEGDVLMVSRLDRLAHSTRDLLDILARLAQRGAALISLGDSWADTTTPHGRLMLAVLGGTRRVRERADPSSHRRGPHPRQGARRPYGTPAEAYPGAAPRRLAGARARRGDQADLVRRFNVSKSTISRLADKAASPSGASAKPTLDVKTERAARAFMQRIEGKFPAIEGLVFGSRARGAHKADSDADLAVILKGERGNRYKVAGEMAGIAFDLMLERSPHRSACLCGKTS